MHKIRSLESLRRSPRPPRRLRRLYSRAFGTRLGACGVSILPYYFYVRGSASGHPRL